MKEYFMNMNNVPIFKKHKYGETKLLKGDEFIEDNMGNIKIKRNGVVIHEYNNVPKLPEIVEEKMIEKEEKVVVEEKPKKAIKKKKGWF